MIYYLAQKSPTQATQTKTLFTCLIEICRSHFLFIYLLLFAGLYITVPDVSFAPFLLPVLLLEGEALKLLLAVGRFPGGVVVVAVLSPAFVAVAFAEKEEAFFFSSLVSSCLLCRPRDKEAAFVFPAAAVVAAVGEEPFSAPFAFVVVVVVEEDIADADFFSNF